MSYLDIASVYKDYIQVGLSWSQQRFHCLSNRLDLMTSDLQPIYALTIALARTLSYHSSGFRLNYIVILLHCHRLIVFMSFLISSVKLYIGHIADWSKLYQHPLVSASANIALSTFEPIDPFIYISCQLQDQTNWHARISSIFWTCTRAKQIS